MWAIIRLIFGPSGALLLARNKFDTEYLYSLSIPYKPHFNANPTYHYRLRITLLGNIATNTGMESGIAMEPWCTCIADYYLLLKFQVNSSDGQEVSSHLQCYKPVHSPAIREYSSMFIVCLYTSYQKISGISRHPAPI